MKKQKGKGHARPLNLSELGAIFGRGSALAIEYVGKRNDISVALVEVLEKAMKKAGGEFSKKALPRPLDEDSATRFLRSLARAGRG